ncbi:polysaccharide biosynthesis tyrosine autokinase [Demequina sp. SYSU T00192]|uniref:non-specific protein-tyrosine kinase n=1 Tax=Demequina litoralis TaxID=3051660 RepID=A0ABT8G8E2_9MICO|nr:polysaccharide biosynthesis tyrosine autokinase [Demequina sp. SYSU T00192]MDN4475412.1 polysaccharide biosynthesis tyrosine autokinase [Demequina sp. SYSU T00192]
MELQDYWRILRQYWILIIAFAAAGAATGLVFSALIEPSYAASSKVFVSTTGTTTVAELAQGNTFTQQRVKTYADLVETSAVLDPVVEELGLDETSVSLRSHVSASTPLNTTVIDITATDGDPEFAAALATATARSLIDTVETIETTTPGEGSPVLLSVVQEADVPAVPTSPRPKLNVALGLVLGLVAGATIALARAKFDTRIRNEREAQRITRATVLGGIPNDPTFRRRHLVVVDDPRSAASESFRILRANLQFLDADREARSFVVTSSVPSEGKSTTTVNLALAVAETDARVLVVEADLRLPKVSSYLGLEAEVGLTDVLVGNASLDDALQTWGANGLQVLAAGRIPPNPAELLASGRMQSLIRELDERFDVVLYDTPPVNPVADAAVLARLVGGALVIVATGSTTNYQLESAIGALKTVSAPVSGIVLTKVPRPGKGSGVYGRYAAPYGAGTPVATTPADGRPAAGTPDGAAGARAETAAPDADEEDSAAADSHEAVASPEALPLDVAPEVVESPATEDSASTGRSGRGSRRASVPPVHDEPEERAEDRAEDSEAPVGEVPNLEPDEVEGAVEIVLLEADDEELHVARK